MIPNSVGNFKRYLSNKTTMKYGYYYSAVFELPFSKDNKRTIRVWLPEDYDFSNPEKRYPVIYFSDGQNLVDRYLSAFGEWELDKTVHNLMGEGLSGIIAVGIDCPKDPLQRTYELCPPYEPKKEITRGIKDSEMPYADKYVDFIVNTLKPVIDRDFYTLKDKVHTAIGGSSMGGIMAYYAYIYQRDVFGFSLSFSPAFFFYSKRRWFEINDMHDVSKDKNGKVFFYVGGKDFEAKFLKPTMYTYEYLKNKKFPNDQVGLIVDTREVHHEKAWAKYLPEALKFWLKK